VARDGFLLLGAPGADLAAARDAAARVPAPVRVMALTDVDTTGVLADALAARPGELWLVRPDAHVAAVLSDPAVTTIQSALQRGLGHDRTDREESDHGVLPAVR